LIKEDLTRPKQFIRPPNKSWDPLAAPFGLILRQHNATAQTLQLTLFFAALGIPVAHAILNFQACINTNAEI
jgi:hypothetical protein